MQFHSYHYLHYIVAIITFIFCFSVLLLWLVLLRHVTCQGLLMLGWWIDWSAVPCDTDGFFLTCEKFGGRFEHSINPCLRFLIFIQYNPPPHIHTHTQRYKYGVGGWVILESLRLSVCMILSGRYLLNCSTLFNQTWHDGVPWSSVSCRKIGSLSRARPGGVEFQRFWTLPPLNFFCCGRVLL